MFKIRRDAALLEKNQPLAPHPDNGDETLYDNKIGSYSKGLPHNETGEVDRNAYRQLLVALAGGKPADFDAIPIVGSLKLAEPQASYVFELEGRIRIGSVCSSSRGGEPSPLSPFTVLPRLLRNTRPTAYGARALEPPWLASH